MEPLHVPGLCWMLAVLEVTDAFPNLLDKDRGMQVKGEGERKWQDNSSKWYVYEDIDKMCIEEWLEGPP